MTLGLVESGDSSTSGSMMTQAACSSSSNINEVVVTAITTDQMRHDKSPGRGGSRTPQRRSPIMHRSHLCETNLSMGVHHGRSQSVRTARRPNRLELPDFRSRVSSMPLEGNRYNPRLIDDEEIYRLRSFSITAKGVVNRGDSLRSRRSRSNTSVGDASSNNSRHSGHSGMELPIGGGQALRTSAANSCASSHSGRYDDTSQARYRVVLLGGTDVGKTSLTTQFMTSEYMNTYDASLDDDFGEKSVSILLDGEESELIFIDHPSTEMSVENFISTYEPHAHVVVYSITDRNSYEKAEDILAYLWKSDLMRTKAVILVANKTDLVRSRVVSIQEGKSLATSHDCKFIETSSGINHNVDELLVGILSQIRLKLKRSTEMTSDIDLVHHHHHHHHHVVQQQQHVQQPDKTDTIIAMVNIGGIGGAGVVTHATGSELTTTIHRKLLHDKNNKRYKGSRTVSFRAKGILTKLCNRNQPKSKSCENLHVL